MKILIADDEIFTREGIKEQVSWDKLLINEVAEAYDGLNALEIASTFKPDILLTDVRMPRMDGIELSFKLREIAPSCQIIFMSGYSDKEYLKAAIKLKAVSYVEKPIDIDELEAAINSAVASKSKDIIAKETTRKHMALDFIQRNLNIDKYIELIDDEFLQQLRNSAFVSAVINIMNTEALIKENVLATVENIVLKSGYNCMSCFKDDNIIILHIFWSKEKVNLSKKENINKLFVALAEFIRQHSDYFITLGKQVSAINAIPDSYEEAYELLDRCFYYNYNSIISADTTPPSIYKHDEKLLSIFTDYISKEDKQQAILMVKRLTADIKKCTGSPIIYIKEIYYFLFLQLVRFASERKLGLSDSDLNDEMSFEKFAGFKTLDEVEAFIIENIEAVFTYLSQKSANRSPIANIMKYIHENYAECDLSLQKISENTYLTSTYICSIFKNHTGKTINKYILEYRLSKAKEMLKDRNMKINDIAEKIGYSDGNYFTKIFRKEFGLTPSEYRQKYLS